MGTRTVWRIALPVSIAALMATALPAAASPPTTYAFQDEARVMCGSDTFVGIGDGTYTVRDAEGRGHYLSQTTFHIVWEFVNEGDSSDAFTYIDTGVGHVWVDSDGLETFSVSGHTTANPELALQYGRWVDNESGSIIQGHATGCTLIPPEPAPWMEVITFEGHIHGHQFPVGEGVEYSTDGENWFGDESADGNGDVLFLDAFEPRKFYQDGTIEGFEEQTVSLRVINEIGLRTDIDLVDLTYDELELAPGLAIAGGAAVDLMSDQLLFCYDGECDHPSVAGNLWSIDPSVVNVGDDPSFINYFDDDGDAQQVVDPRWVYRPPVPVDQ